MSSSQSYLPRTKAAFLVGTILLVVPAFAGTQKMSFLDVLQFRAISQGTLSDDGRHFAYVVSELDWKEGKRFTDIWLSAADGTPSRQMTFTANKDESSPAFSPDGRWLAFLSNRDAAAGANGPAGNQLYVMAVEGGEARKLTSITGGVASFAFSRDGKWIAILGGKSESRQIWVYDVAAKSVTALSKHATAVSAMAWSRDSSRIYFTAVEELDANEARRMELKFDVKMVNPVLSAKHLWEIPMESRKESRLTSGAFSIMAFEPSEDGKWIAITAGTTDRYADPLDRRDTEAYLWDIASKRLDRLTNNKAPESLPAVSPDGKWVALVAPDEFTYFRNEKVWVRPIGGGEWKKLAGDLAGEVNGLSWGPDSRTLYFGAGVGVAVEWFAADTQTGAVRQVTKTDGVVRAVYEPEAKRFVVRYETPKQPADFYLAAVADLGSRDKWIRLSDANPQTEKFALGEYETVRWKSTDGQMVEGLLIKPVGYEPGKKYPLIVQLHGGPASAEVNSFSTSWANYVHVFAAGGYAVLQPNYRGSTNYGEKFRMAIIGDYFKLGYEDIMSGVDEMIRRGIADPDKMGMMGWSAGGHWSNWTLTHTNRFKAISTGAGASNWISMYAETDVHPNREVYFQGTPYDNWDHYIEISPLRYIKNAKTPTLIHVGNEDQRVPRPQSEELHMALKKLGVPTEFIIYPRMGHPITEPRLQMVKMVSEYNWFEKWIKGKQGWFDWKEILDTVPKDEKGKAAE